MSYLWYVSWQGTSQGCSAKHNYVLIFSSWGT